jgi:ubiquinone biosynthesis protein
MAEPSRSTRDGPDRPGGPGGRRALAIDPEDDTAAPRARPERGRVRAELSLSNLPYVLARWFVLAVRFWIASFRILYAVLEVRLTGGRRDRRARVLRQFLERSGGAFIKLGQLLAMRIDFFPAAFVEELSALLDRVPAFPTAAARAIIEADLGASIDRLFSEFPDTPIAAASFAQVYRAVLVTGEEVAVKVQRPNLGPLVAADIVSLRWLGFWIDTLHLLGSIRIGPQIASLKEILEEELDYGFEAESIRTALAACRNYRIMKVPELHDDYCGPHVLTMEFLRGTWTTEILTALRGNDRAKLDELRARGLDFERIAARMFQIGLRQLFEVKTFHADPHAANIVILPGNVIGYVDFGIIGVLDDDLASRQERFFDAVKDARTDDAVAALERLVVVPERLTHRMPDFRRRMSACVRAWLAHVRDPRSSVKQKSTARLLLDTITVVRESGFLLMEGVMRLYRALILSDVIVLQIDPEFDALRAMRRYFYRRRLREFRHMMRPNERLRVLGEYFSLWAQGPTLAGEFIRSARADERAVLRSFARVRQVFRFIARLCPWGAIALVIARLFDVIAIAPLQPFGVSQSIPWYWAAAALLVLWRVLILFTES